MKSFVMVGPELSNELILQLRGYEERVITTFSQLNGKRIEIGSGESFYHFILVFLQQSSINLFLFLGHLHIDYHFIKFRNGLLHIFLDSSQKIGF
jgi:hypothetical protein